MINNISCTEKVCYNISMVDLTEKNKIKEYKTKISKSIINLAKNNYQYYIE